MNAGVVALRKSSAPWRRTVVVLLSVALAGLSLSVASPAKADTALYKTAQWTATPRQVDQVPQYRFSATGPCPYGTASVGASDTGCGAGPVYVLCSGPGNQDSTATISDVVNTASNREVAASFTATCPPGGKLADAEIQGTFDQQPGSHGNQAAWLITWPGVGPVSGYLNYTSSSIAMGDLTWNSTTSPTQLSAHIVASQLAGYDPNQATIVDGVQVITDGPCLNSSCGWALQGGDVDPATKQIVPDYSDFLAQGHEPPNTSDFNIDVKTTTSRTYDDVRPVLLDSGGRVVTVGDWQDITNGLVLDGYNGDDLSNFVVAAGGLDVLCAKLAAIPSTNLSPPSSLNDLVKLCLQLQQLGTSVKVAIGLLVAVAGTAVVVAITSEFGDPHKKRPGPGPGPGPGPDPGPKPGPIPPLPDPSKVDQVVAVWQVALADSQAGPDAVLSLTPSPYSETNLRTAARRCLQLAAAAVAAGAWPAVNEPCEQEPVLVPAGTAKPLPFPGMEYLNAHEAAQHDLDAIAQNPAWVQLNYMSGANKAGQVKSGWYVGTPPCEAPVASKACDEYPLYATTQGGPPSLGGSGASLRVIDFVQNRAEGIVYGGMVGRCGLTSAPAVPKGIKAEGGSPFLVDPMPDVAMPSFYVCLPTPTLVDMTDNGGSSGGGDGSGGGGVGPT